MEYLDFDLDIGEGNGLSYPLAARSPAGEARETMTFPYTRDQLELRLKDLTIALLRAASISRQNLPPELQSVKDMGADFFNALLTGDIRSRYDLSRRMAEEQGKGLRVRLRIQAPELSALPWEYLYDPRNSEYLCLSTSTPLVRYLEVSQVVRPMGVNLPLRVLGMICSPSDQAALDVALEKRRVEEALAGLQRQGQVELTWLEGQTWSDLQDALLDGPWHVFHFIGHGGFDTTRDEGFLALARDDGTSHRLHATELARLLADHRELRIVVINACQGARSSWESIYSSTAAVLVRRGIACAVAMQFSVTDKAAVELARRFYTMLARGLPVDAALTEARKALSIAFDNSVEWGTPVLFMRSPNGVLFEPHTAQPKKPVEPDLEEKKAQSGAEELQARGQAILEEEKKRISALIKTRRQGETSPEPPAKAPELPIPESVKGRARREGDRLWVQIAPGVEMEFVRVPEGEFWMGSDPTKDKEATADELPRHKVWLDEYWIGRYPVTNAQYEPFVSATKRKTPASWVDGILPAWQKEHPYPVNYVSWEDAAAFCAWSGFQLPTEAEWEKAARGTDGRKYPWGSEKPDRDRCNIKDWYSHATAAGRFSPKGDSPYGCADMLGNVWEWCADWYSPSYYEVSPNRNPAGPESGDKRVLRGPSWYSNGRETRCASRYKSNLDSDFANIGFRVVLGSNPPVPQSSGKSTESAKVEVKQARTAQPSPIKVTALPIPESVKGRARREGDRLWVQIVPGVEMEFVRVPEGLFVMGSDPQQDHNAGQDEQPQRQVWLDEYWIGRYPVTNTQYGAYIKALGKEAPRDWKGGVIPSGKQDHPVVNVQWIDASAFCQWAGLRLPTEAQWEKAARGQDGRVYPWGKNKPDRNRCNLRQWFNNTTPVGKFSPQGDSPYGCADMSGNVWEWCADHYDEKAYSQTKNNNPMGPAQGNMYVLRGGSWFSYEGGARCATRGKDAWSNFSKTTGFRAVILLTPGS